MNFDICVLHPRALKMYICAQICNKMWAFDKFENCTENPINLNNIQFFSPIYAVDVEISHFYTICLRWKFATRMYINVHEESWIEHLGCLKVNYRTKTRALPISHPSNPIHRKKTRVHANIAASSNLLR